MKIIFEERPSDSPFVERVWHSQSDYSGAFTSIAMSRWELVIWWQYGKTYASLRGPETKATLAPVPGETEFLGILFKHDAFMPQFPRNILVNSEVALPAASNQSFWLHGSAWQFPDYDNAEIFVNRLVHDGLLLREPIVESVLQGQLTGLSLRTAQRRFLQTTGLTQSAVYQIERARYATILLQSGVSILDTVEQAGYFDQPHLTRSLKRYIGLTPGRIMDKDNPEPLSLLYKPTFFS